jgi:hypothetical protein
MRCQNVSVVKDSLHTLCHFSVFKIPSLPFDNLTIIYLGVDLFVFTLLGIYRAFPMRKLVFCVCVCVCAFFFFNTFGNVLFCFAFETASCDAAQACLELMMLLPQPPKGWTGDHRGMLSGLSSLNSSDRIFFSSLNILVIVDLKYFVAVSGVQ